MSRPSTEAIYVVRVVSRGSGQGTLPSERRYSATTVGGLAVVHAILALTLLLLGALHVAFMPSAHAASEVQIVKTSVWDVEADSLLVTIASSSWVLTSVCITVGPVITGVLSWKQWYLEANLRRFLAASVVAFAVSSASAAITGATLLLQPRPQESKSSEDHTLAGYVYQPEEVPSPCNLEGPEGLPCNGSISWDLPPENTTTTKHSLLPSLAANATVAAVLEALACLASLRVAWSGVRKREEESKESGEGPTNSPSEPLPPIRIAPDIVPCESTREYEERMRRFVADAVVNPETIGR